VNEVAELRGILELDQKVAQRIRHSLSSGLSLLDTSAKSAAGKNVDYSTIFKLQGYGTEKIRIALAELDKALEGNKRNETDEIY
jgi:hypothetical protein